MILRLVLLCALLFAVGMGIRDMFADPTAETAAAALTPTPEKVERAREVVEPVVRHALTQTPESMAALVQESAVELDGKLGEFPVHVLEDPFPDLETTLPAQASPSGAATRAPAGPPPTEWYRGQELTE